MPLQLLLIKIIKWWGRYQVDDIYYYSDHDDVMKMCWWREQFIRHSPRTRCTLEGLVNRQFKTSKGDNNMHFWFNLVNINQNQMSCQLVSRKTVIKLWSLINLYLTYTYTDQGNSHDLPSFCVIMLSPKLILRVITLPCILCSIRSQYQEWNYTSKNVSEDNSNSLSIKACVLQV